MRFARRLAKAESPAVELRTVETATALTGVLAPKGWTDARVEAWLDWAFSLPADLPAGDLPPGLLAETSEDGLLGGGPGRHARRIAALGWLAGLFDRPADALAFRDELVAAMLQGLLAFGRSRGPRPEVLAKAGYASGLVGKWGIGVEGTDGVPNKKGFDFFYGYLNNLHAHNHFPAYLWRNDQREPLPNEQGTSLPSGAGVATKRVVYSADKFADEAIGFVEVGLPA